MAAHGGVGHGWTAAAKKLVALATVVAVVVSACAAGGTAEGRDRLEMQHLKVKRHLKRLNKTPLKSIKVHRIVLQVMFIRE